MKFNVFALIQICAALVVRDVEKRQASALDFYKKIDEDGLSKRDDIEKRQASALDYYKKIDEEGLSKREVIKRTVTEVCCQAPFIAVNGRCVEPNLMTFDEPEYSQSYGDLNDGYFGLDWISGSQTIYFNKVAYSFYPGMAQGVVSAPNGLINNQHNTPLQVGSTGGVTFSVATLYVNSLANPTNIANFVGTLNGVTVATYSVPITNGTPVFVNLGAQGFSNIDKLSIIGDGTGGSWILIDDLSTNLTNA
ncbi:hypothetical protein BC833DRAFT_603139 [Globomyces pollinis-pini]|nr:hypothetical protein BC833DRAFT_603139 [Globomyces pollinis-pini]